jgi:hypothetical protein
MYVVKSSDSFPDTTCKNAIIYNVVHTVIEGPSHRQYQTIGPRSGCRQEDSLADQPGSPGALAELKLNQPWLTNVPY